MDNIKTVFGDAVELESRIAIYVPSTTEATKEINNKKYVDKVAAELSAIFGGATAQAASGYWLSDTHGLIAENVTIVYSNATAAAINENAAKVRNIADTVKTGLKQESVSVEINGRLYLIS